MVKNLLVLLFSFLLFSKAYSQSLTQTVRGKIVDSESKFPLVGATVQLLNENAGIGATADNNGTYRLENVPVGRQSFRIRYIGYKDAILNNIPVTSTKEVILHVELQESVTSLQEINISARRESEVSNEMAVVSARAFSIEETDRYAGSRGDPARMASNFAGVQGADDSRNDIVIRGNSPQGVLWQVEGVPIPNPNHFNIPGTAGGPVSIINNKTLANSDFYTGAFPAQFGNSIAGVFDLKLRNGNNERHEFSGQLGFLGTELFAEGPFSKNSKASYLAVYRYSTLSLFSALGIDIGTTAVPRYQDLSFKMNFPLKKGGNLAVFGIGGISNVDILISDQKKPERNIFGENDRDQYFKSDMAVGGISYNKSLNEKTFVQATLATTYENVDANHELVFRHVNAEQFYEIDSIVPMLDYRFKQNKQSLALFLYHKLNKGITLNTGINTDLYYFSFIDSVRNISEGVDNYFNWRTRWNQQENALLIQPYVQLKWRLNEFLSLNVGVHQQFFTLNNSQSLLEPRGGLEWNLKKNSFRLGLGKHSQMQPTYIYFYSPEIIDEPYQPINKKVKFTRSNHYVLSWQRPLGKNMRILAEGYYQNLYDVPVEQKGSSFSLLNTGAGFTRFFPDVLVNEGKGENYGIELTVEKFFSKNYLFLVTGSLFESKYQGSDGIWRDTDFNGNFILNGLFSREFTFRKDKSLGVGTKVTWAGGRRYGPVDEEASERDREVVFIDAERNSLQMQDYFRADFKLNYKINRRRFTHEIALDLVNVFDTKNILKLTYAPNEFEPTASSIREEYQLGFLPIFYYRLDF